ncbi:MAG: hypothetical protein OEZ20_09265 [candidate division WOR-3 bacterium]|nr:hypothetical protein [candidate division WOR-3 bacterium]MDH5684638.1 hypothetical protein [candidate division WOR-3 bacterium]
MFDFNEIGGPASANFVSSTTLSLYDGTATNPAILSQIGHSGFALVHTKPFAISNLSYHRLIMNLKRPFLGFALSSLGQPGYYEYIIALATSFALKNNFAYGLILKLNYLSIGNYGKDFLPSLNLGILYRQSNYRLAVVLEDLNNPKSRAGDLIPASVRLGCTVEPVADFRLSGDFLKSTNYERLLTGVDFSLLPMVSFRVGIATNPYHLAAGIGISLKTFSLDYACRYHTRLKETHILSLAVAFKS